MLEHGDKDWIVRTTSDWEIRGHQSRGYDPWYTLHKRRRFLWWSWWSRMQRWGERESLEWFVNRWEGWDDSAEREQYRAVSAKE